MSSHAIVPAVGQLDFASVDDGLVHAAGWILPRDGEPLDGVDLFADDRKLDVHHIRYPLPSPDVAENLADPTIGSSVRRDECRFAMVASCGDLDAAASLLRVQARRGDVPASPLLRLPSGDLAPLTEEDADVVGGGLAVGTEFLGYFLTLADLAPTDRVLDVGCGVGRMAWPLAHYLRDRGAYAGFDIMPDAIERARTVIGARRPHFRFDVVDLHNDMYNAGGTLDARTFAFPYDDRAFEFAFLTSVLTHLGSPETRHYIDELARVVAPGGRVLATAFLLTGDARAKIAAGESLRDIRHPRDETCWIADPDDPELAVGYDPAAFLGWFEAAGFRLRSQHPGMWCGRDMFLSFQDVLVFERL